MRASRASVIAGLALLAVAPLPIATAISAAATPVAPRTVGLGDTIDDLDDTVDTGTGVVGDVIDEVIPPEPEPEVPAPVPVPEDPEPEVVVPTKPSAPKPPATTVPKPAPAPDTKPIEDNVSDSGSGSSSSSKPKPSSGSGSSSGGGTSAVPDATGSGSTGGSGLGPTLIGDPLGAQFAGTAANTSSIRYSGAAPLLPEANAGDPNIRSLLITDGQRKEAISPVGDETAGSVTGLLVLGTLASLMLYGSAAYLKFGKRRPVDGRHKA